MLGGKLGTFWHSFISPPHSGALDNSATALSLRILFEQESRRILDQGLRLDLKILPQIMRLMVPVQKIVYSDFK